VSFNVQSFCCTYNELHIYMAHFPLLPSPFAGFPLLPFVFPSTYLAPSSCDRNLPPPSQVACKLTPFAPPFTQLTHPPQIPRTPPAPRLTMTTSGIFRLLLSGTLSFEILGLRWASALPDPPPPLDHVKNHLIWVDSMRWSPWLAAGCSLSA
jgi:hypothetical protein